MLRRVVAALSIGLAGCAHQTFLVTNPSAASIWIDDRFVCVSPCYYRTPATELHAHTPVRIETPGFETQRTELQTHIAAGRIIAGFFTVGLVPLFRWPRTYPAYHTFNLRPLNLQERMAELDRLRETGEVTQEEYERLHAQQLDQP